MAQDLYKKIRKHVSGKNRQIVSSIIFNSFWDADADDWDEESLLYKDMEVKDNG
jgi:hypothetical protein